MRKCFYCGLRALLIQKDTKPSVFTAVQTYGLRALLIQKDTKLQNVAYGYTGSLRALLIQKDTKQGLLYLHPK